MKKKERKEARKRIHSETRDRNETKAINIPLE